jgi:hypothetical protein
MFDGKFMGQLLQSALGRLSVKSALVPFLWLCVTMTPVCFFAAYEFRMYDREITVWLLRLGATPPLVTLLIGLGFSIFKPALLQSEDYQLRAQSLQLLQGRKRHEVIDPDAVIALANPVLRPALPAGDPADAMVAPDNQQAEGDLVEQHPAAEEEPQA